jgi:hypothetical protein
VTSDWHPKPETRNLIPDTRYPVVEIQFQNFQLMPIRKRLGSMG